NHIARVVGEQVANIGSDIMTSDIILKLSQKVYALLARDDVDGVVISHGTDTLDETAYFLRAYPLRAFLLAILVLGST
ncbi:asparaginase domain-containing protein, partial [Salmonella enterica]|uniref:asparaginase domain-containing protein n=1 Tax=Salmonella enterica TaxID=28901 RepID=UPI001F420BB1